MIITKHFRSICLVGLCCIAALICYMITQRVSLERRALLHTEREILNLQQTIRHLQTEKDTLARSGQIDRWNAEAFALVSPKINQFVSDDTQLAAQDSQVDNSNTNLSPSHDSQSGFRQVSYVVPSGRGDEQFSTPSSYKPEPVKKVQYNHSSAVSETTLAPPAPAQNTIKNDNKGMTKLAALSLPNNHYSKIQAVR
ncbi:hypothetical protein [Zymomonas mobilis]|uniref:hypothetical protein n=1 Tax=Zymomonas mobilis TaxID=542 RepID=UPI0039ED56B8